MYWWPGDGNDVEKFTSAFSECAQIRPRTEKSVNKKSVNTWLDTPRWEGRYMNWAHIEEVSNILIIVDAGSGWMRQSPHGRSHTLFVLSTVFGRFEVPHTLVFDNAQDFINYKIVTWLQAQGCTNLESPIYNPRSNGLAEWAVHTVKKQ